jgi:hypothetical protein
MNQAHLRSGLTRAIRVALAVLTAREARARAGSADSTRHLFPNVLAASSQESDWLSSLVKPLTISRYVPVATSGAACSCHALEEKS